MPRRSATACPEVCMCTSMLLRQALQGVCLSWGIQSYAGSCQCSSAHFAWIIRGRRCAARRSGSLTGSAGSGLWRGESEGGQKWVREGER